MLKCCTQYLSKCGKLSSVNRIGKSQFSFQPQRMEMAKKVQTTIQLCSFHMLLRLYSKFFKLGFSSMWIENFQMYKLGFREEADSEIKLPTFTGSWRKQGNSRKTSTSSLLTMLKSLTVWIIANCGKLLKLWEYQTTLPVSCVTYMHVWKQQLETDMEQQTGAKLGKEYVKAEHWHPAYLTSIRVHHVKCQAGWITSWNQDCQEKHQ